MYGTIARMRIKPGMEASLREDMRRYDDLKIPGYVSTTVYRMDNIPIRLRKKLERAFPWKTKRTIPLESPVTPISTMEIMICERCVATSEPDSKR